MIHQIDDYDLKHHIETGNSPESYAERTGFSLNTIRKHLITMAENNDLDISCLVKEDEQRMIVNVLAHVEWDCRITSMYHILEGRYSYFLLRLLFHSESFLSKLKDVSCQIPVTWDTHYLDHILFANRNNQEKTYMRMPGVYIYFLFGEPEENGNGLLFVDVTRNLGKIIDDSRTSITKIGYIQVETEEEGKALARYYTAGLHPKYPSYGTKDNVILSIDEEKLKPKIIEIKK